MEEIMPVSFNPATFIEGGGLWDSLNLRWVNPRFVSDWNYKGKGNPVPAFVVDLIDLSDNNPMEPQAWSVGNANDYQASADGVKPAQSGDYLIGGALRKSSNLSILLESIGDAIPDKMKAEALEKMFTSGKASDFDGLEVHMVRKVVDRPGLEKKKNPATGQVYENTVPIVDSIIKYPWEKSKKAPPGTVAGSKAAPAAAAKAAPLAKGKLPPPPAKKAAASDELETSTKGYIATILEKYPEGILICCQKYTLWYRMPRNAISYWPLSMMMSGCWQMVRRVGLYM
jgi:hypothetical protein